MGFVIIQLNLFSFYEIGQWFSLMASVEPSNLSLV